LIEIFIHASVEVLGESRFGKSGSLTSLTFESCWRLSRIEKYAFHDTGLIEIVISSSVEALAEKSFLFCASVPSLTD
jgi:hypothetical protein